jgi:transcriptional regulator with XRE-family HTH domain
MTFGPSPTARRRRLAAELRELRIAANMSGEQAAERLEWSTSKLSRIENARIAISPGDVRELLALYDIEDRSTCDVLVTLAREARKKGWWHTYGDVLLQGFDVYVGLEAEASALWIYEQQFIPGLLQTEDYTRALFQTAANRNSPEEIERRVTVRMARRELLTRSPDPLELWAVLDEAALRRQVGGPEVMAQQNRHLLEASALPNVTLQVMPFNIGAHPGMAGAFSVLGFPEPTDPEIVYFENQTSGIVVEDPDQIRRYRLIFDHLMAAAVSPDASVSLIAALRDQTG